MLPRRTFLAGSAALICGRTYAIEGVDVACPAGRFMGERVAGIARFRGIRYGRAERFRRAAAIPPSRDPIRATSFGPACPQRGKYRPQSEDCLFLNIWTPASDARAGLPVMVYVHGGAYANGSVTDPENDGASLAEKGVVLVTVNHRLNALGYLYLAPFDPRLPDSGNNGQLDLILALIWVRANIAAFGGDPARVTLFGQSGGGAKIATLAAMPAARGLFHRAATMSGQQVEVTGAERSAERTRAYLAALKIAPHELSPLLTLPVERLIEALATRDPFEDSPVYMGPVLDRRNVTRDPFRPDAAPAARAIAWMLGGTRDETRAYFDPDGAEMRTLGWDAVGAKIAAELPVKAPVEAIVAEYRRRFPGYSPADIFFAVTSDGRSWRPMLEEAEALARAGRPAFVYQFDFPSPVEPARGAFHALDIPFVFGTLADSPAGTGAESRAVSAAMQERFVAFARTGTPNAPGLSPWPVYRLRDRATMIFDRRTRVVRDPRGWQRRLFAPYPYTQPGT
ncbi:carboxylesterase/lipase family protein [Sphingomonas sp.]|uniref:carboxylesterase/lipase family protein n=1 Tax=Sphingomonas sp. TaxID=28214 RepID=UPI002EDB18B4